MDFIPVESRASTQNLRGKIAKKAHYILLLKRAER
jgi:hypothetical protein